MYHRSYRKNRLFLRFIIGSAVDFGKQYRIIGAMRVCLAFITAAMALLGSVACQDYYFNTIRLETIKEQTVVVPAAKPIPADILFIVDNSCSMEDEQQLLGQNFDAFIRQIVGSGDYRIAIISTDVYAACGNGVLDEVSDNRDTPDVVETGETCDDGNLINGDGCNEYCQIEAGQSPQPPSGYTTGQEQNGTVTAVRKTVFPFTRISQSDTSVVCTSAGVDHGCFRGLNEIVITSSMAPSQQIQEFSANVALGSCGSGTESGISSLGLALESTRPGRCNAGFLRDEANLVVIFVSDEDDQLADSQAIADTIEKISQFKPLEKVRVGVIAGLDPLTGEPGNCRVGGDTCGSFCSMRPQDGSLTPCNAESDCPNGEFCEIVRTSSMTERRCQNRDLQYFDISDSGGKWCSWCSFYGVDDCCSSRSGRRYIEFARAIEAKVTQLDPKIESTSCRPMQGKRVACLVDSICQESFSDALESIARDLVSTDRYTLDPPACNPDGVTVVVGGNKLNYPDDFDISDDGTQLVLTGVSPGPDDEVEIFFVIDGCSE